MNAALRQVREIRAKVAGMNKANAARYLWKDEDGTILDGMCGNPVSIEEITENDVIVSWDWGGEAEPPKRPEVR